MCGPTASGKSELSDELADRLSETCGVRAPTLVVDAMQVYEELPAITNQARRRRAEMVGIVPVTEEWTVARHRDLAEEIISRTQTPFVLDAGTGMYLNAILLDIPLAPKVSPEIRERAQEISSGEPNPRRAARAKELELASAPERSSIWDGELRYATTIVYLRPDRESLDASIAKRSERISRQGLTEAAKIKELAQSGAKINPSVLDSIGVRELVDHLDGEITLEEATRRMSARTRRLARRQIRWFDKLAHTLQGHARVTVAKSPAAKNLSSLLHCMHDTMGA